MNEMNKCHRRFGARISTVAAATSCSLLLTCVAGAGAAAASGQRAGAAGLARHAVPAGTISTVAGGVGGPAPATTVALNGACGVATGHGSTYISDYYSVRRVDPNTDLLTTPAGVGPALAPASNGGPAVDAGLNQACGVAVDPAGNPIVANGTWLQVVAAHSGSFYGRQMTAGHIYTVAGGGRGYTRAGVPATSVKLSNPTGVAVDAHGNLLIADSSTQACGPCPLYASVVHVVAVSSGRFYGQAMKAGDIYTIAGGRGNSNVSGDAGPARKAGLGYQLGAVAVDQAGNVVFDQWDNSTVRLVAAHTGTYLGQAMTAGHIYTVAGDGQQGFSGDGGRATSAELSGPFGATLDRAGNLVIGDTGNNRTRVVAAHTGAFYGQAMTTGHIYTIAGNGTAGYSGNGGPATSAELNTSSGGAPYGIGSVAVDRNGNLLIADTGNVRIRVVPAQTGTHYGIAMTAGHIYTIAGNGSYNFSGMGGPATAAEFGPQALAMDAKSNLVLSTENRVLVSAARSGTFFGQPMRAGDIYPVAGDGAAGYSGDGGPATGAELSGRVGVTLDQAGNLVIADIGNNRTRVVAAHTGTYYGAAMTTGHIYTIAGNGTAGYSGDGGPATSAALNSPADVKLDGAGNLIIADSGNNRVRVVAAHTGTYYGAAMTAGHIYTIAGDGTTSYSGDGGPATSAAVVPAAVALDTAGNVVIAEPDRIRVVAVQTGTFYGQAMTAGDIYTVAGDGGIGNSGDGGPATSASVTPFGVTADPAGNLVITADEWVRVVAVSAGTFYGVAMTAGDIYAVAGKGIRGYTGDGGPATSAEVFATGGVLVTSGAHLLFADALRVRAVTGAPTGPAAPTRAGSGAGGL